MTDVLLTNEGNVATITLNRPDHGNAIDMSLATALADAATDCASDTAIRCVILTGAGRMFCVGGDIGSFASAGAEAGPFLQKLADKLHEAVVTLAQMDRPLVTSIQGPAAGAGMSLAILGDIAVAATTVHFTTAYTGIGLTPDGGMSWLLPNLIGQRRALDLLISNRRLSAQDALSLGLVSSITEQENLLQTANDVAQGLATGPIAAYSACRKLVYCSHQSALAEHLGLEAASIAGAASGKEGIEGVDAFLARRKPIFE